MTPQRILRRPGLSEGSSSGTDAAGSGGVVILNRDLPQFSDIEARLLIIVGNDMTLNDHQCANQLVIRVLETTV